MHRHQIVPHLNLNFIYFILENKLNLFCIRFTVMNKLVPKLFEAAFRIETNVNKTKKICSNVLDLASEIWRSLYLCTWQHLKTLYSSCKNIYEKYSYVLTLNSIRSNFGPPLNTGRKSVFDQSEIKIWIFMKIYYMGRGQEKSTTAKN